MNLSEILSNEELRNHEFPVTREQIFLAHAGDCPLPRRVAEAVTNYARQATTGDQETIIYPRILEETRKLAARLLNSKPEEVSLVGPTSLALSFIAAGLKFRKSDNILIYFDDYPSNVYPWMALAEKGVQVRLINIRELGQVRPVDVMGQVDENTRLVALASCHFVAGTRLDYQAIGKVPPRTQHSFLLSTPSRPSARFPPPPSTLISSPPTPTNGSSAPAPPASCSSNTTFRKNSIPTFTAGTTSAAPITSPRRKSFSAAMPTASRPAPTICSASSASTPPWNCSSKSAWITSRRNSSANAPCSSPRCRPKATPSSAQKTGPESASGIVTFFKPGDNRTPRLHQKLAAADIITSLRSDRAGQLYIRLSPHFYNTDAELHRLLEMV